MGLIKISIKILILSCFLTPGTSFGQQRNTPSRSRSQSGTQDFPHQNLLAISQGISSPAITSSTIISNSYGRENPVNAAFVGRYRASAALDIGSNFGFGGDFGWGDSTYGVSVGYRIPSCEGCSGFARGQLAANWNSFGVGLGVANGLYTLGLLFNGRGKNRLGILAEVDNGTLLAGRNVLGLGYSYVNSSFTAALEGTYVDFNGEGSSIKISPGISIRIRQIAVTFNYDMYIQNFTNQSDHGWFGVGYTYEDQCHLALYVNYVNDWTVSASYFF